VAIVLNPHPVSWSDLPGWVKAVALNDDRFRGAVWTSTGNGGYVARQPSGDLIDVVRDVPPTDWYDLPTWVKNPLTNTEERTAWAKSLTWYQVGDRVFGYDADGEQRVDASRE
jgi:hypothetical protein